MNAGQPASARAAPAPPPAADGAEAAKWSVTAYAKQLAEAEAAEAERARRAREAEAERLRREDGARCGAPDAARISWQESPRGGGGDGGAAFLRRRRRRLEQPAGLGALAPGGHGVAVDPAQAGASQVGDADDARRPAQPRRPHLGARALGVARRSRRASCGGRARARRAARKQSPARERGRSSSPGRQLLSRAELERELRMAAQIFASTACLPRRVRSRAGRFLATRAVL